MDKSGKCQLVKSSVSDLDTDWIWLQSGQWIRIQEDKDDPQKKIFNNNNFQFLVKKTLDPNRYSAKMLDPDLMNPDPKHWLQDRA